MGLYDDITWDNLTEPERKLAECVRDGAICDFTNNNKLDPNEIKSWEGQPEIRGRMIVALALETLFNPTDRAALDKSTTIWLRGAKIIGFVTLDHRALSKSLQFYDCWFKEQLSLNGAQFPALHIIRCKFSSQFYNSIFAEGFRCKGSLFIQQCFFDRELRIDNAEIGTLYILDSHFLSESTQNNSSDITPKALSALRTKIFGIFSFSRCQVRGAVDIDGAEILGPCAFQDSRFENSGLVSITANDIVAKKHFSFFNVISHGGIDLGGAKIGSNLNCALTKIGENSQNDFSLDLERAEIDGNIFLRNDSYFNGTINAVGIRVLGNFEVTNVALSSHNERVLRLDWGKVFGAFILKQVKFINRSSVDLLYAHVGQLADDSSKYPLYLTFNLEGFRYDAIAIESPTDSKTRIDWLKRTILKGYFPDPYRQLAKVLHQMGHETDARAISIARMDAYRERGGVSRRRKLWLWFIKWTAEYGYEPWRALYFAGAIVVLSAMVAHDAYHRGVMHPVKERVYLDACYANPSPDKCSSWLSAERRWAVPIRLPKDYPEFNSLVYAIDVFFPFVDLHQEDYWEPNATRWGGFFRLWMWSVIVAGWILSTIGIAAFTGIVKDKDD